MATPYGYDYDGGYGDSGGNFAAWQDAYAQQAEAERRRMEEEARLRAEEEARRLAEEEARRRQDEDARRAAEEAARQQQTVDRSQMPPSPTLGDLMQPPPHAYSPGEAGPGLSYQAGAPEQPTTIHGTYSDPATPSGASSFVPGAAVPAPGPDGSLKTAEQTAYTAPAWQDAQRSLNGMSPDALNEVIRNNPRFQQWLNQTRQRAAGMSPEERSRVRGLGLVQGLSEAGLPTEIPHDYSFNWETGQFERDSFMERNPWVTGALIAGGIAGGAAIGGFGSFGTPGVAPGTTAAVAPTVPASLSSVGVPTVAPSVVGGKMLGGFLPDVIKGITGIGTQYMANRAQSKASDRAADASNRATDLAVEETRRQMDLERERMEYERERDRLAQEEERRRYEAESAMATRQWEASEEERMFRRNLLLEDRAARGSGGGGGSAPRPSPGSSAADLRKQQAIRNLDALLRQGTPGYSSPYTPATAAGPTGRG